MIKIQAIAGELTWNNPCEVRAKGIENALRAAIRRLGLRGQPTTRERVGESQFRVGTTRGDSFMFVFAS